MRRYPGGIITGSPVEPSLSAAPGVWTLEEALYWKAKGQWPVRAVAVTYTDSVSDETDNSTYTFSTRAIGTAQTGRIIVVGAAGVHTAGFTFSSVTIGGNSAAAVATQTNTGGGGVVRASLYALQVDAGTTATIVVNASASILRGGIGIWALYGAGSATASDTDNSVANPMTFNLDVPERGAAIGFACNWVSGVVPTHAWSGITESFDIAIGTNNGAITGAALAFASAQSGLTITSTPSGSTARAMVGASWGI